MFLLSGDLGALKEDQYCEALRFGGVWFLEAGGQTKGKWIPGAGSSGLDNVWGAGQGWGLGRRNRAGAGAEGAGKAWGLLFEQLGCLGGLGAGG